MPNPPSSPDLAKRGRVGGFALWATVEDRSAHTAPGRAAAAASLDARLCAEYGIDPTTPNGQKRLESARKAHFARLALRSAQARRRKGGQE